MSSISSNSCANASSNSGFAVNMLAFSLSSKLGFRERSSDFSWPPAISPSMLSASAFASTVGAELRTLALSSASSALVFRPMFNPKYDFEVVVPEEEASLDSLLCVCESAYDSCVVGSETKLGLEGATECEVEGRDSSGALALGRGGSGGGVPSREMKDKALVEGCRVTLRINLRVGLLESCWSVVLLVFDVEVVLGGALSGAAPVVWGSSLPFSSIEGVVTPGHGQSLYRRSARQKRRHH
jgi:hypothetical protein